MYSEALSQPVLHAQRTSRCSDPCGVYFLIVEARSSIDSLSAALGVWVGAGCGAGVWPVRLIVRAIQQMRVVVRTLFVMSASVQREACPGCLPLNEVDGRFREVSRVSEIR